MKKKILFTVMRMNVGGVEKALLGMFSALDPSEFEIHLAIILPEGGFLDQIPEYVKVHTIRGFYENRDMLFSTPRGLINAVAHGRLLRAFLFGWRYARAQMQRSLNSYYRYMLRHDCPDGRFADPDLDSEFDLAVSFPGPPGEPLEYYIADHIKARRKVGWIHFDIDRVHVRYRSAVHAYRKFERIFCVSEKAREVFVGRFPEFAEKVDVFHNIVVPEQVVAGSKEESLFRRHEGVLNIVTVGRIEMVKAQDESIRSIPLLMKRGVPLHWHFVGGGSKIAEFKALAEKLGVENSVTFYDAQVNPYPFMRQADVYVQPSRSEGFCITLSEAKIFGMPIAATDFAGASEQLDSVPNAIIIPRLSPEAIADAVVRLTQLPRIADPEFTLPSDIGKFLEIARE